MGGVKTNSRFSPRFRTVAAVAAFCAAALAHGTSFYTVRFGPGGGTGTMADASFASGRSGSLPACSFVRTGYTFAGWSRAGSATVDFANRATVRDLSNVPGARLEMVANWTPNSYTVRFHANGGTGTMADQSFVYDAPQALRACAFSRADYSFSGWALSPSASASYANKAVVSNLASGNGAVVHLYATWTERINRNLVVCMGDSITQGYNCAGSPYPSRLASLTGKTVLNYGVAGDTSGRGLERLPSALARKPGTVTILFGANDVHGKTVSWTIGNLRSMIRSVKATGARAVIATPTPQRGKWSEYNSKVSQLASAIRSLASSEGVTCVDLNSAFGSGSGYIQSDGLHLTDAGGALIASKFASAL